MASRTADALAHPSREELQLGSVLHALSDPMRLKIVAVLSIEGEQTCGSISVPVSKSTCTHHFRVLREAGVIHQRQVGTARLNTLRVDDLDARFPGLLSTVLVAASMVSKRSAPPAMISPRSAGR